MDEADRLFSIARSSNNLHVFFQIQQGGKRSKQHPLILGNYNPNHNPQSLRQPFVKPA
ncbi:hypothetical protein D3C78_1687640 [compost metagenome]